MKKSNNTIKNTTNKLLISGILVYGALSSSASFANSRPSSELIIGAKLGLNYNKYSISDSNSGVRNFLLESNNTLLSNFAQDKANKAKELTFTEALKNEVEDQINTALNKPTGTRMSQEEFIQLVNESADIIQGVKETEISKIKDAIDTNITKIKAEIKNLETQIQSTEEKIKALKVSDSISNSDSKVNVGLGISFGFQINREKFSFAGNMDFNFLENKIESSIKIKNSFNYALIGKVGYEFKPTLTGYALVGVKFGKYDINYLEESSTKKVNHFVFGIGGEKRLKDVLGLYAELNYETALGSVELNDIAKKLNLSNIQLNVGARYYFDAPKVGGKIKNIFKKSEKK